uniref:Uncharacterized protein n=1 Tax=Meloidogyne incognita TaxID=6306 RepID=A0A914LKY5_MELIC
MDLASGLRPAASKRNSALRNGCKSRASGPRNSFALSRGLDANLGPSALEIPLPCLDGWMQISGLRPSKFLCFASMDGCKSRAFGPRNSFALPRWMDANLGPSALEIPMLCLDGWMQISGLRPSKFLCLASMDGCKSRAFGPRNSYALPRWMDANLGPSALEI